jgi:Alkylmercury lyase
MDSDLQLRAAVYRYFADRAEAPPLGDMARTMRATPADVKAGYQRLYARRMLVPMADGESIRMAPPFSGIPTQHVVRARGKEYFANCAWDSFGIPAALQAEGDVLSRCEQSGEPLRIHLGSDGPPTSTWLFHVAVPAAHWWRDIVYT